MNIFGQFPWSDTTRYNLDWIVRKIKELEGKADITVDTYISETSTNPVENRAIYKFVVDKINNIGSIDGEVF